MIEVHYDYSTGKEVSYIKGKELKDNFCTHVLEFFDTEEPVDDVIVRRKDGSYISRNELLNPETSTFYTDREIRIAHNIQKLLKAGAFKWRPCPKMAIGFKQVTDEEIARLRVPSYKPIIP